MTSANLDSKPLRVSVSERSDDLPKSFALRDSAPRWGEIMVEAALARLSASRTNCCWRVSWSCANVEQAFWASRMRALLAIAAPGVC